MAMNEFGAPEEPSRPRRLPAIVGLLIAAFAVLTIGAAVVYDQCMAWDFDREELEKAIGSELQPGASSADIIRFLQRHDAVEVREDTSEPGNVAHALGVPAGRRFISGVLRDAGSVWYCTSLDAHLIFVLDGSGKLDFWRVGEMGRGCL
jgi:hypothetical protein